VFCIVLGPLMMSVSQNDSSSRVNVFFRSLVSRALRCVESHEHRVSATAADISRLGNGCSLYVWCLVCPRSHSALPRCLHFHRHFAQIRSSFRPTSWIPLPFSACLLHFYVSPFSSFRLVPSLLLLPLSSPSNLISLRPFLLLLLCPPLYTLFLLFHVFLP